MIRISEFFKAFFAGNRSGGFILIGCTVLSLLLANSVIGPAYMALWDRPIGFNAGGLRLRYPIEFWVNDALMTIFFVYVGLEIKRELLRGELASLRKALLPVFAALGGMIVPALIHFLINNGSQTEAGFGIPMATDIAFALGALSLLGNRIPAALKVFLTAFAIIDDLGAIVVIAVFYTERFLQVYLFLAAGVWCIIFLMGRFKVNHLIAYVLPLIVLWYCFLQSGVHATISGVLFAFALPSDTGNGLSCSSRLEKILRQPVTFLILPLFAFANTGVKFPANWDMQVFSRNSLGIIMGLIIGKPLGIISFTMTAVKCKLSNIPASLNWSHIFGAALLGGMGFTMSIFITLLAFEDPELDANSKIAILLATSLSGILGCLFLRFVTTAPSQQ
jgi:Na+:H+ antiporter, NhaA family